MSIIKFCPYCGTPTSEEDYNFCPYCGKCIQEIKDAPHKYKWIQNPDYTVELTCIPTEEPDWELEKDPFL